MLAEHPIDVMVTAPDLAAAKRFHRDGVGLDVLIESDEFVTLVPRLGITTAVTVPIMTWIVMPRVTHLLRGWLYPRS